MKILKRLVLVAIACWAFSPISAAAQDGGVLDPRNRPRPGANNNTNAADRVPTAAPQPRIREGYPVWVGYVVMVLMAAGIMTISLMPSKRSHQD